MWKVLLVEDEVFVRESVKEIIDWEKFGFTLAGEANNGQEALNRIMADPPHLVLTDIVMPVMDGITALQHIRSRQAQTGTTHTPIMILSAHAMLGDRENMLAAGADAYLAKPIAITSMREEISRLMDSRLHAGSLG